MNCTVKGCRGVIRGMTGLQELDNLRKHFARVHKLALSPREALEVRVDVENGKEPNVLRAMLGTNEVR